jgi:chitinase
MLVYSPYLDVLLWPTYSAAQASIATGTKLFILAFVVSDKHGNASWGNQVPICTKMLPGATNDHWYFPQLKELRELGGDAIISFGGAGGSELACTNTDLDALVAQYQAVIDMYAVTKIDFDIEGSATEDPVSINRRNLAIAVLKSNNPHLHVSYTLSVTPAGLSIPGLNILKSAVECQAEINLVNIMAMDYGPANAPNGKIEMGKYAISAAKATYEQLKKIDMSNIKVGVTPMVIFN